MVISFPILKDVGGGGIGVPHRSLIRIRQSVQAKHPVDVSMAEGLDGWHGLHGS